MSIGDTSDIVSRIRATIPRAWFPQISPLLDATLTGIASALSGAYSLISYAKLQTRIATATDAFLDIISLDFFGGLLPRKGGEPDPGFRSRIQAQLLLERGTRKGMVKALTLLTGRAPAIFEAANINDTGAYNTNTMGYGVAGGYGSLALAYQSFITAYRPIGQGVPNISGYGNPQGAYNTNSALAYINNSQINGITDADILSVIDSVKPLNAICWTQIKS